jgi:hypothetical protein
VMIREVRDNVRCIYGKTRWNLGYVVGSGVPEPRGPTGGAGRQSYVSGGLGPASNRGYQHRGYAGIYGYEPRVSTAGIGNSGVNTVSGFPFNNTITSVLQAHIPPLPNLFSNFHIAAPQKFYPKGSFGPTLPYP